MDTKTNLVAMVTVILLVSEGYALKCHECIPGPTGLCTETQRECPDSMNCAAGHLIIPVGEVKLELNIRSCVIDFMCYNASASVNVGYKGYSKCCHTDLCNDPYPTPPVNPPLTGLKCYICNDNNCSDISILQCTGDQDRCISGKGDFLGQERMGKGCASKSMCQYEVAQAMIPGIGEVTDVRCCKGDLCNSATRNTVGILSLVAPILLASCSW